MTAAARRLGVAKSTVSKHLAALEDRLGAQLVDRSTRRVTPTPAGRAVYEAAARAIALAREAERRAALDLEEPVAGRLRVAAPASFGRAVVADAVGDLLAFHPDVAVEVDWIDRPVDPIAEGYDVAIRVGRSPRPPLAGLRLAPVRLSAVASPAYLDAHGRPRTPADLGAHALLCQPAHARAWPFVGPDGAYSVRVRPRLCASDADVVVTAAVDGLGVALVPDFAAARDLAAGRLESVLSDACAPLGSAWAVRPERRPLSPAAAAFLELVRNAVTASR
ncbi:MAG: LysR family transcriptional regulator [Deltaproteobacteria bacterium]|nr:MAG: LysR family transcriptional regulator [Deltaproteobacteria bacterium]